MCVTLYVWLHTLSVLILLCICCWKREVVNGSHFLHLSNPFTLRLSPLILFFSKLQSLITYHQQILLDGMQFWATCDVTTFAVQLMVLKLILSNEDKYNTILGLTQPQRQLIQIPWHQLRADLNHKDTFFCSMGHAYSKYLCLFLTKHYLRILFWLVQYYTSCKKEQVTFCVCHISKGQ